MVSMTNSSYLETLLGFYRSNSFDEEFNGYDKHWLQDLHVKMMVQSIRDLSKDKGDKDYKTAVYYFNQVDEDYPMSFDTACYVLKLNSKQIRKSLDDSYGFSKKYKKKL